MSVKERKYDGGHEENHAQFRWGFFHTCTSL